MAKDPIINRLGKSQSQIFFRQCVLAEQYPLDKRLAMYLYDQGVREEDFAAAVKAASANRRPPEPQVVAIQNHLRDLWRENTGLTRHQKDIANKTVRSANARDDRSPDRQRSDRL